MTTISELYKNEVERLENHPAIKFANDAIVLQAVRSGTGGYQGKENLTDFLHQTYLNICDLRIKELEEKKNHYQRNFALLKNVYLDGQEDGFNSSKQQEIEYWKREKEIISKM